MPYRRRITILAATMITINAKARVTDCTIIGYLAVALVMWQACASNPYPRKFRLPDELIEVSGLYAVSEDSLWWHNDGGWPAKIYHTNARGELIQTESLSGAKNKDWEDITADAEGTIYIGDFGNNLNSRKDLRIYRYDKARQKLDSILFTYPDQESFPPAQEHNNFDTEAMFWYQDSLHLFSKNTLQNGNFYTKHYVLLAQPGKQEAILRDSIFLKNRVVTAAAISPDGKTIALLAYRFRKLLGFLPWSAATMYWIRDYNLQKLSTSKIYKKRVPSFLVATQFESIDFIDEEHLYIASERTAFIKQKAKRIQLKKRFFKKCKQVNP